VSASDFRDTLLELIDTSPEPMDHPTPDQWLAYQRGELSAGEEERLQEHLVRCRDCFDLAAAAAAFAEPGAQPGASQDVETAALWRLLRPQLDLPEPSRQNVREISDHPRRRSSSWRFRLPTSLAASFLVALVALSVSNIQQRKELQTLRAPKAPPVTELAGGERFATLGAAETTLAAPAGPWLLVLHPGEELPVYRLAIRDAETGQVRLSSDELRPVKNLGLIYYVPEGIGPGRYRLELSDGSGGRVGKVLETHLLRVTAPDQGEPTRPGH
jgi:anti-sigma factor RsiW